MQYLVKSLLFVGIAFTLLNCSNDVPTTSTTSSQPVSETITVASNAPVAVPTKLEAVDETPTSFNEEHHSQKATTPKPVKAVKKEPQPVKSTVSVEPVKPVQKEEIKMNKEADVVEPSTTVEQESPPVTANPEPAAIKASHDAWDQLLRTYVSADGKVNYKAIQQNKAKLEAYLKHLNEHPVDGSYSKNETIAYWINAYNAFTVKLIVDNYPVKSIMDLHGGKAWDQPFIQLGGKTYTLNNIEHDILRAKYKDARVHYAVNCAAKSCPPLLNRAWTAATIERYYNQQAKNFINSTQYNKLSAKAVELSQIFEWYAVDFPNLIDHLNKYASTNIEPGATISYIKYNWALNE